MKAIAKRWPLSLSGRKDFTMMNSSTSTNTNVAIAISLGSAHFTCTESLYETLYEVLLQGLIKGEARLDVTATATATKDRELTSAIEEEIESEAREYEAEKTMEEKVKAKAAEEKTKKAEKSPKYKAPKDITVSYKVVAAKGASIATAGKIFYCIVTKEDLRGATRKYVNRTIGVSAPEKRKVEIFGAEYVWGVFPTKKAATEAMAALPKEIKAADVEAFINRGWKLA